MEKKSGLDIFVGDEEIAQTFQQVKTLISATKTQQIFYSICQHLQLQYEQQTKDNSFEYYRLRIFWLSDSHCSDVLPILDLLLNLSQQTVHVPLYFDLIFGFFDQCWSSNNNNRSLNNIQQWTTLLEQIEGFSIIESTLNENESTLIISQKTTSNEILQRLVERKNQLWLIFIKDDNNKILSSSLPCSNIKIFHIHNSTLDIICFGISVLLTTYKQVSIIFAWQLDQVLLNENNDDLALKQNEELICGTFSRILQTIQKSSPYFYPFVYVLTDNAQFNNDSNLNIIASLFIGLARSLITDYERNCLKLIDLRTSLNNQLIFIYTLIEYMINSRYSTDTCQVVLRLNHTNQNEVQHLTWHYEMLQNNDEQEKFKYEQIPIIPKRDTDQKPFRLCVPQSRFLSELTWIEENREKELSPSDMVD
ncbi:unnamed protein product [Adineta steineri]|uniref:Uncharacterized protein n=1 Tax=Adineta steineri TaxID=433720 RepID=A0A814PW56_9BILA|nr:unnamed protein product [Adineta steineri]